jgi:hypothetical protein
MTDRLDTDDSSVPAIDDANDGDTETGGDPEPRSIASTDDSSTTSDSADQSTTVTFDDEDPSRVSLESSAGDLLYETTPTLRPVLLLLGTVLVAGSIALSIPLLRPELFGDPAIAEIVLYAIGVLVAVTAIRLAVRLVILWKTTYEIREDALVRRYDLAYKRSVREIPVGKLRGHEFSQSRYQTSLDVGTIRLLTAGTNRSLGFLAFEHLEDPDVVQREIQALFTEREREFQEV